MKRFIMEDLCEWYRSRDGRILFICGAPRVGKRWLIEELCRENNDTYMHLSAKDCISKMAYANLYRQIKLKITGKTDILVIEDINTEYALRVVRKIILRIRTEMNLPDFRIIMVGTIVDKELLLKCFIDEEYVKVVRVFPMNFEEFKEALSGKYQYDDHSLMKMYLIIGGMPECVNYFLETGDFTGTRDIQRGILEQIYKRISKKEIELLHSIPMQLESEGTSFTYRKIHCNAREREYGGVLEKLERQGIVYRLERYDNTSKAGMNNFKLYVYDVGLTGALKNISEHLLMDGDELFIICNELLVKTFVLQQLQISNMEKSCFVKYWHKPRAKAKLPFVFEIKECDEIIPIEIACGKRHDKSIMSFEKEYKVNKIIRLQAKMSCINNAKGKNMEKKYCDIPLYNISNIF